ATAIVGRITADIYRRRPPITEKGEKAVVTSVSNEFHELGARIVADFLEMDGWNVYYLGGNVPEGELLKLVKKTKPKILALSCTMPFNLERTAAVIREVRQIKKNVPKIIVGGLAFNIFPELHRRIGADFWAPDAKTATLIVQSERGK
ncbi:MAG: cobalamin B12-binding domain-containing protein, partial [Syntrophales bacterium]|nr:cobalamin B12-binding domain-containing protein [Syntrophales bacterium]